VSVDSRYGDCAKRYDWPPMAELRRRVARSSYSAVAREIGCSLPGLAQHMHPERVFHRKSRTRAAIDLGMAESATATPYARRTTGPSRQAHRIVPRFPCAVCSRPSTYWSSATARKEGRTNAYCQICSPNVPLRRRVDAARRDRPEPRDAGRSAGQARRGRCSEYDAGPAARVVPIKERRP
jgi:hypothetical protein